MIERRCLFRRTDFETVKVRIDSQPAGALRWNDKRGWIPDAECEQRLNLYLPEHAKMWKPTPSRGLHQGRLYPHPQANGDTPMFQITMIASAMGVGYAAAFVGIPPVEMFGMVSFAALCGEYVRRLTLHFYRRRSQP